MRAPGATDGWALETGTAEWFVKFKIEAERDFTPGRRYRLCVRAKGNAKKADGPGLGCGISRKPGPLRRVFSAKELADGKFHTLEVGEIELDQKGGSFWIALARGSSLRSVLLDCFWLVEAQ